MIATGCFSINDFRFTEDHQKGAGHLANEVPAKQGTDDRTNQISSICSIGYVHNMHILFTHINHDVLV